MKERQWGRGSGGRRSTDRAPWLRVLVVDDDPRGCLRQAIYLRALGCKVFTAHDGVDAIEQANALMPDVIVMDLQIPRVDSCEAVRRLNESSATRKIPVVAITADPNTRLQAFEAGCTACLTKPCAPQIVWAQICALLKPAESRAIRSGQG
jgi:CheY-like chemotaxis protein